MSLINSGLNLDIPVFTKTYELYKTFYGYLGTFPKKDRYTLGQKCELLLLDLLEGIILASSLSKEEKLPILKTASLKLDVLKVLFRLCKDLKIIESKKYLILEDFLQEIGKIELAKLYEQRQAIIEKNLSGVYSDEIFKEQNALLEDKITKARMAKDDTLIKKYNLEELVKFIEQFFADLGKTYLEASLTQKRALLSSIFASKLSWNYPGYSNCQISPIYQAIRDFPNSSAPLGEPPRDRTENLLLKRELL